MRITVKYWCKKCKMYHREDTLIGIEHNRYNQTKQLDLNESVCDSRVK